MSDNQRSMPDTSPGRPDDFSAYFDFDKASASASAPQEQRDSNIDGGASGSAVEEPVEVRLYR